MSKLNVLVCGSTGYIGLQLIKILKNHKKIFIKLNCSIGIEIVTIIPVHNFKIRK